MVPGIVLLQEELRREISKPYDESDTIVQCGTALLSILQIRPDEVLRLAHEHLHSFPYKDVPESWRRLYTEAALWKAVNLISEDDPETKFVEILDMAVILTGAPRRQALIRDHFSFMGQDDVSDGGGNGSLISEEEGSKRQIKRQKLSRDLNQHSGIPKSFPKSSLKCTNLDYPITREHNMTLTSFQAQLTADHQRNNHQGALPLIITEAITHWPAISNPETSWNSPGYWLKTTLGGRRLVPIEIGRAYTDADWGQKIIPFKDFMSNYLLALQLRSENQGTGYLAQHDLFTQIPSLRNDIIIPEFCYSSPPSPSIHHTVTEDEETSDEPAMNIWLGPASTTSPLHTDPHHNILAQVFGHKYVRMYAPSQTKKLYPRSRDGNVDMSNTSRVDVGLGMEEEGGDGRKMKEGFEEEFPLFKDAEYVEGILGPGECLFIPCGWWHYVKSLSPSCSVSFWWD